MSPPEIIRSYLCDRVTLVVGDLVEQRVDAIVNAADATHFSVILKR